MGRANLFPEFYNDDPLQEYTNYASSQCGAKVVDSSPGANGLEAILSDNRDTYLQMPCVNNRYFVIRLCDYIKVKRVVIDNHEYFSSKPSEFKIYVTDKYTVGVDEAKWRSIGSFVAKNLLGQQIFDINEERWAKFVKIKFISRYGQYNLCPLNFVAVLGTNMLEEAKRYAEKQSELTQVDSEQASNIVISPSIGGTPRLDYSINNNNGIYENEHIEKDGTMSQDKVCRIFSEYLASTGRKPEHISKLGIRTMNQIIRETLENCLYPVTREYDGSKRDSKYELYLDEGWIDLVEGSKSYDLEGNNGIQMPEKLRYANGRGGPNMKDLPAKVNTSVQNDSEDSNVFENIIQRISKLERDVYQINNDIKLLARKASSSIMELGASYDRDFSHHSYKVKQILYTQNEIVHKC